MTHRLQAPLCSYVLIDLGMKREVLMNFTEHTKIRKEKFGTVIFDTLTEKIFITDQIGSEILCLIEQGKDLLEIVSVNFRTFINVLSSGS